MAIKFFKVKELDRNLKATVHQSGKMGFTIEASNKMELTVDKSISIGMDEDNKEDTNLYVVVNDTKEENSFPVLKAGDYYYINTKPLFSTLKIDYKKNNIAYEITKDEIEGMELFVFELKQKERDTK